jgi:predicted alpha/beta-fold hydrolase
MRRADFTPRGLLRNPHVQSLLASSSVRARLTGRHHAPVRARAVEHLVDCGDDVTLMGRHDAQVAQAEPNGLIVLLHGWEGSSESSYILDLAARFNARGWDTFRLNFRDHGGTHHLNRDVFHSCRIDEVVGAVAWVAQRWQPRRLGIAGYSLGGNFALRVALRAPARGIPLGAALAVCPAIRPRHILDALEQGPRIYHDYFMWKWRASLKRKQTLFPDYFQLAPGYEKLDMRALTAQMVERYTQFPSLDAYFDGYSVHGDRLAGLAVPAAILTAADDPIIPIADFRELLLPAGMELSIADHGGHCGFVQDWSLSSYAPDWLVGRMERLLGA